MVRSTATTDRPVHDEPQPRRFAERADLLNGLLALNRDAEEGFEKAAELAESTTLKGLFERARQERASFARALRPLVKDAGGEPDDDGTLDGSMHRVWMQVRQKLSPKGDKALVNECERAEDEAVKAYRRALDADLPAPVHAVLDVQAQRVFAIHDTLSDMKHGRAAS